MEKFSLFLLLSSPSSLLGLQGSFQCSCFYTRKNVNESPLLFNNEFRVKSCNLSIIHDEKLKFHTRLIVCYHCARESENRQHAPNVSTVNIRPGLRALCAALTTAGWKIFFAYFLFFLRAHFLFFLSTFYFFRVLFVFFRVFLEPEYREIIFVQFSATVFKNRM